MAEYVLKDGNSEFDKGYIIKMADGEILRIFAPGPNDEEKLGTAGLVEMVRTPKGKEIEALGRQVWKDVGGLGDLELDRWKETARKSETDFNAKIDVLKDQGIIPEGYDTPRINAVSSPEAGITQSDAQAAESIGFIVDINGNYNPKGSLQSIETRAQMHNACGVGASESQIRLDQLQTEFTLYHEVGHQILDQAMTKGDPVMRLPGMSDQEALAFQDYAIGSKQVSRDANGDIAYDQFGGVAITAEKHEGALGSKTGQIASENFSDTFAAISFLRAHSFSPEAVDRLRKLSEDRVKEQNALSANDVANAAKNGSSMPEYGAIDEHRIQHAIKNVLSNIDAVKATPAADTIALAGRLSMESTAVTMADAARTKKDILDGDGQPSSVLAEIGKYDVVQGIDRARTLASSLPDRRDLASSADSMESAAIKFTQAMSSTPVPTGDRIINMANTSREEMLADIPSSAAAVASGIDEWREARKPAAPAISNDNGMKM